MNRIFSCLVLAGLLTVPAVASAEPQYVYVRQSGDQSYLYVTDEPRPIGPVYVRDAQRYDNQVGAICGSLRTDIFFAPADVELDSFDRTALSSLGYCLSRGALAGAKVELVAGYDGTYVSGQRASIRLTEVISHLRSMGVSPNQLTFSKVVAPGWQSDHVSFRFVQAPWPYVVR